MERRAGAPPDHPDGENARKAVRKNLATKKIRVYELARELGVENQVVLDLSDELKMGVKSHSSSIDDPSADRIRRLADSRDLRGEPIVDEPKAAPKEKAKKADAPAKKVAPKAEPVVETPEPVAPAVDIPAPVAEPVTVEAPAEPVADAPAPPRRNVVRSTGGIPAPAPRPARARKTKHPAAPAAGATTIAPPPPPPPAPPIGDKPVPPPAPLRSSSGKPIPPPPGQRVVPPPP